MGPPPPTLSIGEVPVVVTVFLGGLWGRAPPILGWFMLWCRRALWWISMGPAAGALCFVAPVRGLQATALYRRFAVSVHIRRFATVAYLGVGCANLHYQRWCFGLDSFLFLFSPICVYCSVLCDQPRLCRLVFFLLFGNCRGRLRDGIGCTQPYGISCPVVLALWYTIRPKNEHLRRW